jgi:hypothetical protein
MTAATEQRQSQPALAGGTGLNRGQLFVQILRKPSLLLPQRGFERIAARGQIAHPVLGFRGHTGRIRQQRGIGIARRGDILIDGRGQFPGLLGTLRGKAPDRCQRVQAVSNMTALLRRAIQTRGVLH